MGRYDIKTIVLVNVADAEGGVDSVEQNRTNKNLLHRNSALTIIRDYPLPENRILLLHMRSGTVRI